MRPARSSRGIMKVFFAIPLCFGFLASPPLAMASNDPLSSLHKNANTPVASRSSNNLNHGAGIAGRNDPRVVVGGGMYPAYVLDQNDKILEVGRRLDHISKDITAVSSQVTSLKQTILERLYPAIFAFIGVLIGGFVSYRLHVRQLKHNELERKAKFSFDIELKIFEYRSKQNNEFYGPLLVLLTQSKELSKQLHEQLVKLCSTRYRFEDESTSAGPKSTLYVYEENDDAKPFRLIEDMPYIGANIKSALPQVKVIIEAGERMAAIIEKSSGLANPKNIELSSCLGVYLAHLAALKDAYTQAESMTDAEVVRTHTAVFPRRIQDLVKADYDEINNQMLSWESKALLFGGSKVESSKA